MTTTSTDLERERQWAKRDEEAQALHLEDLGAAEARGEEILNCHRCDSLGCPLCEFTGYLTASHLRAHLDHLEGSEPVYDATEECDGFPF